MVRRTKEEAAATRERLLDTAEAVFLTQGVSRSSLQHVASAAGLTRGAIYWHFKDKAELFGAMMDRAVLPCEAARAPCIQCTDPLEAVRRMILQPLEQVRDDERTRRVFTIAIHCTEYTDEMRAAQVRHHEAIQAYTAELAQLLRQAAAQGQVRADLDMDTVAQTLFALVDGLLSRCTQDMDPAEGVRTAEQGLQLLLAGMAAGGAGMADTAGHSGPGNEPRRGRRTRAPS